ATALEPEVGDPMVLARELDDRPTCVTSGAAPPDPLTPLGFQAVLLEPMADRGNADTEGVGHEGVCRTLLDECGEPLAGDRAPTRVAVLVSRLQAVLLHPVANRRRVPAHAPANLFE